MRMQFNSVYFIFSRRMADPELTQVRAPEPLTITVLRARNLVSVATKLFLFLCVDFKVDQKKATYKTICSIHDVQF